MMCDGNTENLSLCAFIMCNDVSDAAAIFECKGKNSVPFNQDRTSVYVWQDTFAFYLTRNCSGCAQWPKFRKKVCDDPFFILNVAENACTCIPIPKAFIHSCDGCIGYFFNTA